MKGEHWIGPKNAYLCSNEITIADYFGASLVTLGELIGIDFVAGNKGKEFARV